MGFLFGGLSLLDHHLGKDKYIYSIFLFGKRLYLNTHCHPPPKKPYTHTTQHKNNTKTNIDVVVDSVEGNAMSSYGFVTFKTLSTAVCGASARVSTANILSVSPSSEPNDIIWQNAHIDSAIIHGREFTSNCFLFLGVIFWSVPVASIQALATIEKIGKS